MKILHLSSEKSWRGGEQQIAYLIEELKKYDVTSVVACRNGSSFEKYCKKNNIPFTSLPFNNLFDIRTALGIRKFANEEQVDIIHMHSGKSHGIGVVASKLGAKAALVLSRRVIFPLKQGLLANWKYNHPKIKKILCVSDKIRQSLIKTVKNPQICVTVYSGIDMEKFSPSMATGFLRTKYNIPPEVRLVGNVAALTSEKDYYTFIYTAEKIINKRKDIRFFIIGEGPEKDKMKSYVQEKNLNDYIFFTGFLSNIPEVLPELDIFLITSEKEGLGTTILDAFLSEVPVVATAAGGIPELVEDRVTGLLAPIKDSVTLTEKVLELLDNKSLRDQYVLNAKERLTHFDKKNMALNTLKYYKEVVDHKYNFQL